METQLSEMLKDPNCAPYEVPNYDSLTEKWVDLSGKKSIYLRLMYGSENPITEVNFFNIKSTSDTTFVSATLP